MRGGRWSANLRPGRHTVALEVVTSDFSFTATVVLNIVRGGRDSDDEDHGDHG